MSKEKKDEAAEGAVTALAAPAGHQPLAPEEQLQADERWNARVVQIKERDAEARFKTLAFHWERGEFLNDLMKDGRKYGHRTVDNFVKDFNVDKATVYMELKFYTEYTTEHMRKLVADNTVWGTIYYTLSVEDREQRAKLIEMVNTKKITRKELEQKVKKLNQVKRSKKVVKGKPADSHSGVTNLGQVFRSTVGMGNDFMAKIEEWVPAAKEFAKLEDGKRKSELTGHVREAHKAFKKIHDKLAKILGIGA